MLNIDAENYLIELTRGDTATISFSAVDSDNLAYEEQEGDKLTFAVAKKVGADPLFKVENVCDGTHTASNMAEASVTAEEFAECPTKYFTESGGVYTRCLSGATYDENETYYTPTFWDIFISSENSNLLSFKDYVYDVQIESGNTVETIIGKTDDITPTLRIWGEVAHESADE